MVVSLALVLLATTCELPEATNGNPEVSVPDSVVVRLFTYGSRLRVRRAQDSVMVGGLAGEMGSCTVAFVGGGSSRAGMVPVQIGAIETIAVGLNAYGEPEIADSSRIVKWTYLPVASLARLFGECEWFR